MNLTALGLPKADDCINQIRDYFAARGIEAHVTSVPPLVATPYDPNPMTCKHGITYYSEPTSDQVAAWNRDGVA